MTQEIWKPWPMQEKVLKTVVFEMLVGGARGPGKTDAGIVWIAKPCQNRKYRGLVIRKTSKDLADWLDRARYMLSGLKVEIVGNPAEIRFPSGAKIRTGHLGDKDAYEQYQGHEYQRILIEELTQIPDEERYLKLVASCRSTVDGIDARVMCTTNPLGVGHVWVKQRFVDPSPPMTKFTDPDTGRTRIFIPGTLKDNPTLMQKDPDYARYLDGLPDDLRKAWRDGSWDILVGQYFDTFSKQIHVYKAEDLKLNPLWPRFMSIDWGNTAPMAVYWHAVGPEFRVYTYREWYRTNMLDTDAAKEIAKITREAGERIEYTVGDPMSFPVEIPHYKFGRTMSVRRADVWAEHGIPITMGDNSRIAGWSRMREYLKVRDIEGRADAMWKISEDCPNLIRELSGAIRDEKRPEDVDTQCSDHGLDSCRLFMMSQKPIFKDVVSTIGVPLQPKWKTHEDFLKQYPKADTRRKVY